LLARITIEDILGKEKSKVPKLKEIETLEGSIEKIKTLIDKLKITANLKEGKQYFTRSENTFLKK
jgi:hypothetical protein